MGTTRVGIVGGSGYSGGELLRILLGHPEVEVTQVTSRSLAKKFVTSMHPNLRKRTTLKFIHPADLQPCDVLFLCVPHGSASDKAGYFTSLATVVIDLSADFRLSRNDEYQEWYGWEHPDPEMLGKAVYGMPELHREKIAHANYIANPGCMSTSSILALYPMMTSGLLDPAMPVVVEVKTGSSGGGIGHNASTHHPERAGVIRSFKATGHRHTAEIIQAFAQDGQPAPRIAFSATGVEAVRGILATGHVFTRERVTDKDIWQVYRAAYRDEPFVRIVKEATGIHRSPEPKILSGTNFCDVGFEVDQHDNRVVVTAAIDNLVKGASGQAVQAMNIRCGFEETLGLEFTGLHPL